jgi:hypothetical protein
MAYTDPRTYILYYQAVPLGSITHAHYGLGWKTGRWAPTPQFANYADFINAYAVLLEAWEDGQRDSFDPTDLAEKYGPALTNLEYWYLISDEGHREGLSILPWIDEALASVTWKPAI